MRGPGERLPSGGCSTLGVATVRGATSGLWGSAAMSVGFPVSFRSGAHGTIPTRVRRGDKTGWERWEGGGWRGPPRSREAPVPLERHGEGGHQDQDGDDGEEPQVRPALRKGGLDAGRGGPHPTVAGIDTHCPRSQATQGRGSSAHTPPPSSRPPEGVLVRGGCIAHSQVTLVCSGVVRRSSRSYRGRAARGSGGAGRGAGGAAPSSSTTSIGNGSAAAPEASGGDGKGGGVGPRPPPPRPGGARGGGGDSGPGARSGGPSAHHSFRRMGPRDRSVSRFIWEEAREESKGRIEEVPGTRSWVSASPKDSPPHPPTNQPTEAKQPK